MTLATDGLANAKAYRFSYADATARGAASGFTAADVGALALQLDDASLWILTDDSPATWVNVAGSSGLTDPTTTKGDLLARSSSAVGRLAVGANDTILIADSTQTLGMRWGTLAGAWTSLPFASGWATDGGPSSTDDHHAEYRVVGDRVELRGRFVRGAGAVSMPVTIATLPSGARPAKRVLFEAPSTAGGANVTMYLTIAATGVISIYALATGTTIQGGFLNGINFSTAA